MNKLGQSDQKCSVKARKRWKQLLVCHGRLPKLQPFYYLDHKVSSVFTCSPDSSCSCLFEQDLAGWGVEALCQGSGVGGIEKRRSQRERGHFFGVSQLRGEAGLPSSWPDSSIKECV